MKIDVLLIANFLLGLVITGQMQQEPTPAVRPQEPTPVVEAREVPEPTEKPKAPASSEPDHAPNILCEQVTYDFGKADNHRKIEHTFLIKNTGDLPLVISDVRRSCGCAAASITNKVVPPGGESEITAKLNLIGRKGHQHKTLTVLSNDPDTPQLRLNLRGEAVSEVDISPNRLFFHVVNGSAAQEKTLEVRFNSDAPVNITSVGVSSDKFSASLEVIEVSRKYRLNVRTRQLKSVGRTEEALLIKTDNPTLPVLEVPVAIDVVGDLSFSPKKLILMQADKPVTRYIVVTSNIKDKVFEIENVEPPSESVKVQVAPLGQNGYRIQLDNLVPSQDLRGTHIKITTSAAGMEEILVPCFLIAPQTNPGLDSPTQDDSEQSALDNIDK